MKTFPLNVTKNSTVNKYTGEDFSNYTISNYDTGSKIYTRLSLLEAKAIIKKFGMHRFNDCKTNF